MSSEKRRGPRGGAARGASPKGTGAAPGARRGSKGGYNEVRRGSGRAAAGKGAPYGGVRTRGGSRGGKTHDRDIFIEGRRASAEALESGMPLKRALVVADAQPDATLVSLIHRLEEAGIPVEQVPRRRLDELSSHGAHQGIVVETRPYAYAELHDVIARAGSGDALVVVLDHVTDEGNLGAIARSAEVVGAAGIVIAGARAAGVGTAAYKTSAGAVLHLPIARVPNLARAIEDLKEQGFWACAATEHAELGVWDAPSYGRLCLVMGSEGAGVSRLLREHCDFSCRLPQAGRVESLNVAQATTVFCYEWLRRKTLREQDAPSGAQGKASLGEAS